MVVAGEIVDAAIVGVDVLARPDRRRGEADDLPELQHRLADLDRPRRHLVPLGHAANRRHTLGDCADQDRIDGDDDVIGGVQPQYARVFGALGKAGHRHYGICRRGHYGCFPAAFAGAISIVLQDMAESALPCNYAPMKPASSWHPCRCQLRLHLTRAASISARIGKLGWAPALVVASDPATAALAIAVFMSAPASR